MKPKTAISALLLSLFFISMPLLQTAEALFHQSITWGTPITVSNPYERAAMYDVCNVITATINGKPNWCTLNNYDSNTYSENVFAWSDYVNGYSAYDFLATFHVGDMYRQHRSGTLHYNYYDNSGTNPPEDPEGIEDTELFPHTGAKHYFTFIWTCANGDLFINPLGGQPVYGYLDTQNNSGIVGMPYAWTQTTSMRQDGYASPSGTYTYIGFENISRALCDQSDFVNKNYGDFVKRFYYHAIVDHSKIRVALDQAMADMGTWDTFGESILNTGYYVWMNGRYWFSKMHVYGNGDMVLP